MTKVCYEIRVRKWPPCLATALMNNYSSILGETQTGKGGKIQEKVTGDEGRPVERNTEGVSAQETSSEESA